jgi:hypothetical protein
VRTFKSENIATLTLVACAGNYSISLCIHAFYKYFHLPAHPAGRIARFDLASVTIRVMLLLTDAILPEFRRFHLGASRDRDHNATTQQNIFQSGSHFPN